MKWLFYIALIWLTITPSFAKEEKFEYSSLDWEVNLDHKNKTPYGTFMFFTTSYDYCSQKFVRIKKPIRNFLNERIYSSKPETYIFIGNNFYASKTDWQNLKTFVEEGNSAFISCSYLPYDIQQEFFNYDWALNYNTDINVNYKKDIFSDTNLTFSYLQNFEKVNYAWRVIPENTIKSYNHKSIHTTKNGAVYIKINYGKGHFYFHSEPLLLSNLNLIEEQGYEYAKSVLSELPNTNIYFDVYTAIPLIPPSRKPDSLNNNETSFKKSPLSFIFENKSLKWAYLLMLFTVIIYVIFKSKRKQRQIALIQKDSNTSMQFVNTMSMLYLKQNNHNAIVKQKKKIFLHFLRTRYFLTIKDIDKQFIDHLSKVSQIDNDKIELIFKYFNAASSNREFSNGDLADLHNNIEFFYKNCA